MLPDLTVQEEKKNVLSPWSISLDASIIHDTAEMKAIQTFWNNSDYAIPKCTYTFPLPAGCAVTAFSCRIGSNRNLKGVVKPKKEAQESFQKQLLAGRSTGLLEENTPEIFTISLGNLPADTKVKIELKFVTVLKHHFGD